MNKNSKRIGLALSGGGIRAMVFHCGVLKWLSENNQLENIKNISSVSGGSLFTGLVFSINNMKWPSSDEYLSHVEPEIKKLLTTSDLQSSAVKNLLHYSNWKFILSRANVFSKTIQSLWGVSGQLNELPDSPIWSANGTTAETGRRFRFKRTECGDYELGYAKADNFSIADSMAVSAAFPVGIGPLAINTNELSWEIRSSWNDTSGKRIKKVPEFKKIHIYDGGVYDNLGIEPLFDIGQRKLKGEIDFLIVSDAGAPLERIKTGSPFNPFRAKRVADIALDQTRALRVRGFVNYIINNIGKGLYIQIGASPVDKIKEFKKMNTKGTSILLEDNWLDTDACKTASIYPTNLKLITTENFEFLSRHGYESTKWNSTIFSDENSAS